MELVDDKSSLNLILELYVHNRNRLNLILDLIIDDRISLNLILDLIVNDRIGLNFKVTVDHGTCNNNMNISTGAKDFKR